MVRTHHIEPVKLAIALVIMLQLEVLNDTRHINDSNDDSHHQVTAIANDDNHIDLVKHDQLQ